MGTTKVNKYQAMQKAIEIYNAHDTRYDQGLRLHHRPQYSGTQYYDCSSFVGTCWGYAGPPGTAHMRDVYTLDGFTEIAYSASALQPGDIVVWRFTQEWTAHLNGTGGHTMLYLGQFCPGYPTYNTIHCTSDRYGGGVKLRSGTMPGDPNILKQIFILRGSGGVYITKIMEWVNGGWTQRYPVV